MIVGASLAGAKAAETLRAEGFTGRVVLVGEETEPPYERPPLSKGYLLGKEPREKAFVHDAHWYAEQRRRAAARRPGDRAGPGRAHRRPSTAASRCATTSCCWPPARGCAAWTCPASDNAGVHYLRTLAESDALRGRRCATAPRWWSSAPAGSAWRSRRRPARTAPTVTVVEMDTLPLRRVLGDEVAAVFADLHRAHGVDFRFGAGVQEFGGLGGAVTDVVLDDGTELPADVAVVGVGIRPGDRARRGGRACRWTTAS